MYWTNQNRIILQIYSIWYLRCQHVSSLTTNLSIISDLTNQIMIPYSGNMNQRHSKKVHRLCHPVLFPSLQSFSLFASVFRVIFSTTEPVHRLTWTQQETWIILSKRTPYHSSATVLVCGGSKQERGRIRARQCQIQGSYPWPLPETRQLLAFNHNSRQRILGVKEGVDNVCSRILKLMEVGFQML